MSRTDSVSVSPHDKYAQDYDRQIENYDCWLSEVFFGLCYEDIKGGETILDVGIGTGLSSRLFHLAGLRIYGIDGSKEMLAICRRKAIASDLVHQDILDLPWPYQNSSIQHVISCGVFHFIGELNSIFSEIYRIQVTDGLFMFSVMNRKEDQGTQPDFEEQLIDGIPVFIHSKKYIQELMKEFHYEKRKEIVCFVGATPFRVIYSQRVTASTA